MHRSELPIRFPCPDPAKQTTSTPGRLYCATCDRDVVELDRLNEREVRALKARADAGERICVRYRVDTEGLIQLRAAPPRRRPIAAAGLATLLACGTAAADSTLPPTRSAPTARKDAAPQQRQPDRAGKPAQAKEPARPRPAPPPPRPVVDMIDGGI